MSSTAPHDSPDIKAFTLAIQSNQWDEVFAKLEQGIDPGPFLSTSLFYIAAARGAAPVVRWLLEAGIDPNIDNGRALISATLNGHRETVRILLERGADPCRQNNLALLDAVRKAYVAIVNLLLDHGADIHTNNDSPLRIAANHGHPELVSRLLSRGASQAAAQSILEEESGCHESVCAAIHAVQLHQTLSTLLHEEGRAQQTDVEEPGSTFGMGAELAQDASPTPPRRRIAIL